MFERPTRDRYADETLRQKIRRWRLILFFPMLGLGIFSAMVWPSVAPYFRPRSGSCTRLFSQKELGASVAPEVTKYTDYCDARYGSAAEVTVHDAGADDAAFDDAAWELSYRRKSDFGRLPGKARAFVAIGEDGRAQLLRLLDGHAFVDVRLTGGIEAAKKTAALLDDGRLATFDAGISPYPANDSKVDNRSDCEVLVTAADVAALWSPSHQVDAVHDWRSGDQTMCSMDFLIDGEGRAMMTANRGQKTWEDEVSRLRADGSTVEPVEGSDGLVLVRAEAGEEILASIPNGVATFSVRDGSVHEAVLSLAKKLGARRAELKERR